MIDSFTDERLRYLANRIAEMTLGISKVSQLGDIALEILIAREDAEEKLKGNYSQEEKEKAKKTLEDLRKLEKSVVRLYLLTKLGQPYKKKTPFLEYMLKKFST